jgi:hypothetical protein
MTEMQTKNVVFEVKSVQNDARGETVRFVAVEELDGVDIGLTMRSRHASGLKFGDKVKLTLTKVVGN